jgi:hypothetical protein
MVDQALPPTVWPVGLLIVCLVLEAGALHLGVDDLDEGYFVQQGARVLHGQVPYRDFFTLYTPGLAYAHAALFSLNGQPTLEAARALSLAGRAALALLLVALARPFVRGSFPAVLWAAVPGVLLLGALDDAPVRWEPHPGWPSTVFAVLAVWCLTHRPSLGWLLAAGSSAGLAYAFKQNAGLFILAAIVVWTCFVGPKALGRQRAFSTSTAACLVPVAAFAAVTLVWLGPLLISLHGDITRLGVLVGAVNQSSLFAPPEPTLLIPLAAILGGVWLLRRDSHPTLRWYLLAGLAVFGTELPRMDTLHLAWSTPILLVVGAIALSRLSWPFAAAALVGAVLVLAPTWTDRLAYLGQPFAPVADVVAPAQSAADLTDLLAEIQQRTRPGEPIFVYPTSPLVYVLAARPNPTRFDHLNPGAASPQQLDQVIGDLQRSGTRLVVISDFWESVWGPPETNALLEDWINAHYTDVARHGAYRVLMASGL